MTREKCYLHKCARGLMSADITLSRNRPFCLFHRVLSLSGRLFSYKDLVFQSRTYDIALLRIFADSQIKDSQVHLYYSPRYFGAQHRRMVIHSATSYIYIHYYFADAYYDEMRQENLDACNNNKNV